MRQKGVTQMMRGRRPKGFTLVEVLIAILIFSLSLLALVPLLSTATSIDRENYLNVRARAMAADTLDTLMGGGAPLASPIIVNDQGVPITTTWLVGAAVGNREPVTVTVTYRYKGLLKTFSLTSQRAR